MNKFIKILSILIIFSSLAITTSQARKRRQQQKRWTMNRRNKIIFDLHAETKKGHLGRVKNIIKIFNDISIINETGQGANGREDGIPLTHYAIMEGHTDIAFYLLRIGANPYSLINKNGSTLLHSAISNHHKGDNLRLIKHFLKTNPNLLTMQSLDIDSARNPFHLLLRFAPIQNYNCKNTPSINLNDFLELLELVFESIKRLPIDDQELIFSQENNYGQTIDDIVLKFFEFEDELFNKYQQLINELFETQIQPNEESLNSDQEEPSEESSFEQHSNDFQISPSDEESLTDEELDFLNFF